jgi:hypothetical protein
MFRKLDLFQSSCEKRDTRTRLGPIRLIFGYLFLIILNNYMFWPNWPSSGVQVVLLKDSAVLLYCCNFLRQFVG